MNKVILMGRLTRDPEVRYSQGERPVAVARYTLAVNRTFKRAGEPDADFINCVTFGRSAEFAEKYFRQGIRIVVSGRIQTEMCIRDRWRSGLLESTFALTVSGSRRTEWTDIPP